MPSDPIHDPLRALFRKAWDTTSGDLEGARHVFAMLIRMTPQSLSDFQHLIEGYAVNRLAEEMQQADEHHLEGDTITPRVVTIDSVRDMIAAAVEDRDGDAVLAALMVNDSLTSDRAFRASVAEAVVEYAVTRLSAEIADEADPERYRLPNGTRW